MRITELLRPESIELGVALGSKEEAIDKLVGLMEKGGRIHDKAGYKKGILAREAQGNAQGGGGEGAGAGGGHCAGRGGL